MAKDAQLQRIKHYMASQREAEKRQRQSEIKQRQRNEAIKQAKANAKFRREQKVLAKERKARISESVVGRVVFGRKPRKVKSSLRRSKFRLW